MLNNKNIRNIVLTIALVIAAISNAGCTKSWNPLERSHGGAQGAYDVACSLLPGCVK